ncbi:hypothetical protein AFL46_05530 [Providencia stuartii]|nr:hypothetical protein AFL46_05530 [Providencia stuartii]
MVAFSPILFISSKLKQRLAAQIVKTTNMTVMYSMWRNVINASHFFNRQALQGAHKPILLLVFFWKWTPEICEAPHL